MGYGYGVWLVLQDFPVFKLIERHNIKPHTSHITVMCNMDFLSAKSLAEELHGIYRVTVNNRYKWFCSENDKYSKSDDTLAASGFICSVNKWKHIINIAKKYDGDIPKIPHLSVVYRDDESGLPIHIETTFLRTTALIFAADINSDKPHEWCLFD